VYPKSSRFVAAGSHYTPIGSPTDKNGLSVETAIEQSLTGDEECAKILNKVVKTNKFSNLKLSSEDQKWIERPTY
jgi:hypothetical protein